MKLSRSVISFTRDANSKTEKTLIDSDQLENEKEGYIIQNEDF